MIGIVLGIFAILLGVKAFTRQGIPLTKRKNLVGRSAKVIGGICIALGALFVLDGVFSATRIISMFKGTEAKKESGPLVHADFNRKPAGASSELDVPKDACDESRDDHELAGKWQIVSAEIAGRNVTTPGYYEFKGNQFVLAEGATVNERTFEMDPRSDPKRLDSRQAGPNGAVIVFRAIYRIEGDTLIISDSTPFHARPDRFVEKTTPENDYSLCTLRRFAVKDLPKAKDGTK